MLLISSLLLSTSLHSPDANPSITAFRFLSLPPEIRLIIYNQLLVQSDGLLRTFCTCKFCANLKGHTVGRDCLNPSLLRTNKAIYNEALPILYSKNVFPLFCWGPFGSSTRVNVSRHRPGQHGIMAPAGADGLQVGPIASRLSPWAGVTKILACPSDAAKPCVRRIYFMLDWVYHILLGGFPTQWWQAVETDVLRYFPGLEQMMVQISAKEMPVLSFYLVFQRKNLMAKRAHDYKSILANSASLLLPRAKAREGLRYIEAICDGIVASHTQGEMKNSTFGVKFVTWTDDYLLAAGPKSMKGISTSIYLGCR